MLGDSHQTTFPRMSVSEEAVKLTRERDLNTKHSRKEKIKASTYCVSSDFKKGDNVLLRNFEKSSKFHPKFQPEPYKILSYSNEGHFLSVERETNGKMFRRHPDEYSNVHPLNSNLLEDFIMSLKTRMHLTCNERKLEDYGPGQEEKRTQEVGHENLCNQVYINKTSKFYVIRLI